MSGENQYYNPIIQAMVSTAQLTQQRERDKEAAKQHAENIKLQTQHQAALEKQQAEQLKQNQQKIDYEHEHQKATVENATQLLHAHLEQARNERIKEARDLIANGVKPTALQNPGVDASPVDMPGLIPQFGKTPEGMISVGGQNLPVSAFPGPQEEAQRLKDRAFATAQGQVEARDPAKEAADLRAEQRQMDVAKLNRDSAERIAQLNASTHLKVAQIGAAAHGGAADLDPTYVNNKVNDIYITGNSTETSIPAKLKAAFGSNVPTGFTPIDPKDKPVLNDTAKIQDVLKIGKQLADFSLDSNPIEAMKSMAGFGDAAALRNQLTGLAGTIAETFGKEIGRKSEGDIQRATKLLYDPKLSKAQNLKNVQEAEKIFKDVLKPILSKYKNQDQLNGILAARGIDPALFTNSTENKKADPLGIR